MDEINATIKGVAKAEAANCAGEGLAKFSKLGEVVCFRQEMPGWKLVRNNDNTYTITPPNQLLNARFNFGSKTLQLQALVDFRGQIFRQVLPAPSLMSSTPAVHSTLAPSSSRMLPAFIPRSSPAASGSLMYPAGHQQTPSHTTKGPITFAVNYVAEHNEDLITVFSPVLGAFTTQQTSICILATGVTGSGKSTRIKRKLNLALHRETPL